MALLLIQALREYIGNLDPEELKLVCFVQVCVGSQITLTESGLTAEEFARSQKLFGELDRFIETHNPERN